MVNAASPLSKLKQAIQECAREPIHIPGSIQPEGCLLVYNFEQDQIIAISRNVQQYFQKTPEMLLGQPLHTLLSGDAGTLVKSCIEQQQHRNLEENRQLCRIQVDGTQEMVVLFSGKTSQCILELEPLVEKHSFDLAHYAYNVQENLGWLFSPTIVPEARVFALSLQELKRITGFDRVMLYRFDNDYNGQVISEALGVMDSYLGLHFPASDIPRQARRLYLKNRIRCIPDVNYQPVPLLSTSDQESHPIDMTYANLRSVSPVHLQYLRNMGVEASMSVSVIVDGRLWGLIAMHHPHPLRLSYDRRAAANYIGQLLSMYIGRQEREYLKERRAQQKDLVGDIVTSVMSNLPHFYRVLHQKQEEMMTLCQADSIILIHNDNIIMQGGAQPVKEEKLGLFTDWLQQKIGKALFYQHDRLPDDEALSATLDRPVPGILAVPLLGVTSAYLVWFRNEQIKEVKWAGQPKKEVEITEEGRYRISPRNSFRAWKDTHKGLAISWEPIEIDMAIEMGKTLALLQIRYLNKLNAHTEQHVSLARNEYAFREKVHAAQVLNQQFKTVIDSSPDALAVIDNDNRFLVLNANYQQMFQDRYGKLPRVGDSLLFLLKESPEVLRNLLQFWEQVRQEKIRQQDSTYHDRRGRLRHVTASYNFVYDYSNKPMGILDTSRDVTEAKDAEKQMSELLQKYSLLVQSVGSFTWVMAPKGTFEQPQEAWENFTGQSFEQYQGLGWADAIHEEDREHSKRSWLQCVEQKAMYENNVRLWNVALRDYENFLVCAVPIFDKENDIQEWFGVCISIQKLKEQEARLESALKALQTSNADLQHFAYVASHDLQEPLRMISSYLELIEKRYNAKLDEKGLLYMHYAVDGAQRMKILIDDLLTYSRISKSTDYEDVSLQFLMKQVVQNYQLKIKELKAHIDFEELPIIRGIPVQLLQLLTNLVGNSLKFVRDDTPPRIKVRVHERRLSWQFVYEDNGIGIDPRYAEKVFNIFFRLNSKNKYPGTGMGLAICQRVVSNHGGKIWVDPSYQEGTRFIFTIRKFLQNDQP